jgi:hypothetical protein
MKILKWELGEEKWRHAALGMTIALTISCSGSAAKLELKMAPLRTEMIFAIKSETSKLKRRRNQPTKSIEI